MARAEGVVLINLHAVEYWSRSGGAGSAHLRAAVERSLARGVFGSPFFLVGEEPFFGLEKMELLDEWLATGGW